MTQRRNFIYSNLATGRHQTLNSVSQSDKVQSAACIFIADFTGRVKVSMCGKFNWENSLQPPRDVSLCDARGNGQTCSRCLMFRMDRNTLVLRSLLALWHFQNLLRHDYKWAFKQVVSNWNSTFVILPQRSLLTKLRDIEDFVDIVWISVLFWSSPTTWNIAYMSGNEV